VGRALRKALRASRNARAALHPARAASSRPCKWSPSGVARHMPWCKPPGRSSSHPRNGRARRSRRLPRRAAPAVSRPLLLSSHLACPTTASLRNLARALPPVPPHSDQDVHHCRRHGSSRRQHLRFLCTVGHCQHQTFRTTWRRTVVWCTRTCRRTCAWSAVARVPPSPLSPHSTSPTPGTLQRMPDESYSRRRNRSKLSLCGRRLRVRGSRFERESVVNGGA
jgi:hypothetical protein